MTDKKKGADIPTEEKAEKKIKRATQKTFMFPRTTDANAIDTEINEWLLDQAKKGEPAMLGKVCSNHNTGDVIYVFLYTTEVTI